MKKFVLSCLATAAFGAFFVPNQARAVFVLTVAQVGDNVEVTGSGTLNTAELTLDGTVDLTPQIYGPYAGLLSGEPSATGDEYAGITGPINFNNTNGSDVFASSGGGDFVGVVGAFGTIYTPTGYVSGALLTTNSTYAAATFASLGFTPATYTFNWGNGANADSFIVTSAVPEPSTWAMLGLGAVGTGIVTLRHRRTP